MGFMGFSSRMFKVFIEFYRGFVGISGSCTPAAPPEETLSWGVFLGVKYFFSRWNWMFRVISSFLWLSSLVKSKSGFSLP